MKVTAYQCQCCNKLYLENEVKGIANIRDMFNPDNNYPECPVNKTVLHYCTHCYNEKVINLVDSIMNNNARLSMMVKVDTEPRPKDELIKDYSLAFRTYIATTRPKK